MCLQHSWVVPAIGLFFNYCLFQSLIVVSTTESSLFDSQVVQELFKLFHLSVHVKKPPCLQGIPEPHLPGFVFSQGVIGHSDD